MNKFCAIFFSFLIFSCKDRGQKTQPHIYDPCVDGKDTTIKLNFSIDTTSSDFLELLELFRVQTEFKNIELKSIRKDTGVLLQKLLCYQKDYKSPIEKIILENVYSLNCTLISEKNVKGYKKYHPVLEFQQINFKSESEKDSALKIISKVGLGDPLVKWNDYTYVDSKTRIYVLSNGDATFQDYDGKYIRFIKTKWIDKSSY
jgi:hypothetical protein